MEVDAELERTASQAAGSPATNGTIPTAWTDAASRASRQTICCKRSTQRQRLKQRKLIFISVAIVLALAGSDACHFTCEAAVKKA